MIYAPSLHNSYGSSAFPGLSDSLFDIEEDEDQAARWREVRINLPPPGCRIFSDSDPFELDDIRIVSNIRFETPVHIPTTDDLVCC